MLLLLPADIFYTHRIWYRCCCPLHPVKPSTPFEKSAAAAEATNGVEKDAADALCSEALHPPIEHHPRLRPCSLRITSIRGFVMQWTAAAAAASSTAGDGNWKLAFCLDATAAEAASGCGCCDARAHTQMYTHVRRRQETTACSIFFFYFVRSSLQSIRRPVIVFRALHKPTKCILTETEHRPRTTATMHRPVLRPSTVHLYLWLNLLHHLIHPQLHPFITFFASTPIRPSIQRSSVSSFYPFCPSVLSLICPFVSPSFWPFVRTFVLSLVLWLVHSSFRVSFRPFLGVFVHPFTPSLVLLSCMRLSVQT